MIAHLLDSDVCRPFALALLHVSWLALLIGGAAAAGNRLLRRSSAQARYVLNLAALLLCGAALPAAFVFVRASANVARDDVAMVRPQPSSTAKTGGAASQMPPRHPRPAAAPLAPDHAIPVKQSPSPASTPQNTITPPRPVRAASLAGAFQRAAPLVTALYLLGVLAMLTKMLAAVCGGRRLRIASRPVDDSSLAGIVAEQSRRLALRAAPAVAYCERVAVPVVVGAIRPMILIPAAMITGLSREQLAAVLTHELAHIRRYDHWTILAQRLIESLLFFHPAAWYLSRRVHQERENACDDLVLSSGGDRLQYAESLLRVAELRLRGTPRAGRLAALAADGASPSRLRRRIARLLGDDEPSVRLTTSSVLAVALLIALLLGIGSIAAAMWPGEDKQKPPAKNPAAGDENAAGGQRELADRAADRQADLPERARLRLGTTRLHCDYSSKFVAFTPDGRWIFAAGSRLGRFDAATGRRTKLFPFRADELAVSPDGKRLLMREGAALVRIWDREKGRESVFGQPDSFRKGEGPSAIAWLPSGKSFAVIAGEAVQIRHAASGRITRSMALPKVRHDQRRLAVSSDGRLLAAGVGEQIRIWSLEHPERVPVQIGTAHERGVNALTYSLDDRTLISGGKRYELEDDPNRGRRATPFAQLRRWNVTDGKLIENIILDEAETEVYDVKLLRDKQQLVVRTHKQVRFIDANTGVQVRTIDVPHSFKRSRLSLSPDGRSFAVTGRGTTIEIWDLATGSGAGSQSAGARRRFPEAVSHNDLVLALAYSPDSATIATASDEVWLWDARSGRLLRKLEFGDSPTIHCVAFSPDGKHCAAGGHYYGDGPLELAWRGAKVWDVGTGSLVGNIPMQTPPLRLAFSPDGERLAASAHSVVGEGAPFGIFDTTIGVYDVATGRQLARYEGHADQPTDVRFSADGKSVRSVDESGEVHQWRAVDGVRLSRSSIVNAGNVSVLSPDGGLVASTTRDEGLMLSDAATGKPRWTLEKVDPQLELAFSAEGRRLAVGRRPFVIVDVATGRIERELLHDEAICHSLALSPNGRELATGLMDGTVLLWPLEK